MVRGVCRAGRPAPGARLRNVLRVVSSAAWILGEPFGDGLGDVMALSVVLPLRCEDLSGFFVVIEQAWLSWLQSMPEMRRWRAKWLVGLRLQFCL